MSERRVIVSPEGYDYSWIDGGYHTSFDRKGIHYEASLMPFPDSGSRCIILKIDNTEDINNITASEDSREVYRQTFLTFKSENMKKTIKNFLDELVD